MKLIFAVLDVSFNSGPRTHVIKRQSLDLNTGRKPGIVGRTRVRRTELAVAFAD